MLTRHVLSLRAEAVMNNNSACKLENNHNFLFLHFMLARAKRCLIFSLEMQSKGAISCPMFK